MPLGRSRASCAGEAGASLAVFNDNVTGKFPPGDATDVTCATVGLGLAQPDRCI